MRRASPVAVVCLLVVHAHAAADPSPEMALLYTDAAYEALLAGELERAARLATVAREFDEASSDALYVSGLMAASRQETTGAAIGYAELAVDRDTWRRFTAAHGAVLLASLHNRTGNHESAAELLASTPRTPAMSAETLADSYYEHLLARSSLGRIADPDDLLAPARDRFPDDPRFFRFLLEMERFPSLEYRLEIERLLAQPAATDANPVIDELVYEYARRAPVAGERHWARQELERRQWHDARLALLFEDDRASLEAFLIRGGFSDFGVYRELAHRMTGEARDALLRGAGRYDGESYVDTGRDGYWNERLLVEQGAVVRWDRDQDQDGVVEVSVVFGPLEPETVVLRDSSTLRLSYGQYPFVSHGEISGESGVERFVLRPRAVELRIMVSLPSDGPRFDSDVLLSPSIRPISRPELTGAAITIDRVRPDGTITERIYQHEGLARQVLRDDTGDGKWDRLLLFDHGEAVVGVRDLTGDGSFEVAEGYRDGRLVALAIDTNGDGVPDVFEHDEAVSTREWDLNGDGRIDAREFRIWTDSVVREFPVTERLR